MVAAYSRLGGKIEKKTNRAIIFRMLLALIYHKFSYLLAALS